MQKTTRRTCASELAARNADARERDRAIAARISVQPRPKHGDWFVHIADASGIVTTTRHETEDSAHGYALDAYLDARAVAIVGATHG